jgi:hypothetical protein
LACELIIVMSPSFGERLFLGMYCFACICQEGSSGEEVISSSRMWWHGTICSFTIKFVPLIVVAESPENIVAIVEVMEDAAR